jgi:hypothetical protein
MLTITLLLSLILPSLLAISVLSLVVIATDILFVSKVYAHFIGGDTKTIDNYQILFLLSPSRPIVGDNSTRLNFSVLDKDQNTDVKSVLQP